MDRNNISRLLHTLVPFMVMTMVQRLLLLVFGYAGVTGEMAELCAFLPGAAAAVILFRVRTYHIEKEDETSETKELEPKRAGVCVLQCAVAVGALVLAMYAVSALLGGGASAAVEASALAVVSSLIVHPVVEEIVFRKMFYGELRLMNPIFGCMMQAVMFAIVHNSVDSMIYALVSGVVLAVLYEKSGRVSASVTAHFCINLRSYLYLTVLADQTGVRQIADMAVVTLAFAAFVVLGVVGGRGVISYDEKNGNTAFAENINNNGESEESEGQSE